MLGITIPTQYLPLISIFSLLSFIYFYIRFFIKFKNYAHSNVDDNKEKFKKFKREIVIIFVISVILLPMFVLSSQNLGGNEACGGSDIDYSMCNQMMQMNY